MVVLKVWTLAMVFMAGVCAGGALEQARVYAAQGGCATDTECYRQCMDRGDAEEECGDLLTDPRDRKAADRHFRFYQRVGS